MIIKSTDVPAPLGALPEPVYPVVAYLVPGPSINGELTEEDTSELPF